MSLNSLPSFGCALLAAMLASGCASLDSARIARTVDGMAGNSLRPVLSPGELDTLVERGRQLDAQLLRREQRRLCGKPSSERNASVDCPENRRGKHEDDSATLDTIEVTGSRLKIADVITNNQESGVDEGDIVKKSGDRLVVLRDGTLYSMFIRREGRDTLELADQLKLAVDEGGEDVWYDEILVHGDRVILLGFNFGHRESVAELLLFRIDDAGRLHRDGRFWLRTEDYFSEDNYGARLQGDNLLISLSLPLELQGEMRWPKWSRRDVPAPRWRALVEAGDLHYPVFPSSDPHVHVLLQCPVAQLAGETLDCRATGFVADGDAVIYAMPEHVFLALGAWDALAYRQPGFHPNAWQSDMPDAQRNGWRRTAVVRIPFASGQPLGVATVAGRVDEPFQFSGTADGGLHLLTGLDQDEHGQFGLHRIDATDFSLTPVSVIAPRALVPKSGYRPPVRFSGHNVWVGQGRSAGEENAPFSELWVQPLDGRPAQQVRVPHSVEMLQPAFGRMLAVGMQPDEDLAMSWLEDAPQARLRSSQVFEGRLLAEGRSHALNFTQLPGGTRLIALPVWTRQPDHGDYGYWERASDMLHVEVDGDRVLDAGLVDMQNPGSEECEYCDDWYGNARAFFVGPRIFALSSNLMKESVWDGQVVRERRRLVLP